jgi:hypothetical protein
VRGSARNVLIALGCVVLQAPKQVRVGLNTAVLQVSGNNAAGGSNNAAMQWDVVDFTSLSALAEAAAKQGKT